MSYSIEYNKKVFYVENENKEKIYFLFIRQGDNNCYEQSGVRAKSWNLAEVGSEATLWKKVGRRLGSINGGGLQKAVGWDTRYYTEEEYIKEYRTKIRRAKPLETIFGDFWISAQIYLRDNFENQSHLPVQAELKEFINKYSMQESGSYYYDSELKGYRLTIRDLDILQDLLVNMPRGYEKDYHAYFNIDKN